MLVLTPKDALFDYEKVKKLWEKHKDKLNDDGDFDQVLKNSHFFSFYENEKLIGAICFYTKDKRLFLNAFSGRKTHLTNLKCLKKALNFYNDDIFAECKQKPAIYCLLKIGFKKIGDDLYKYERK